MAHLLQYSDIKGPVIYAGIRDDFRRHIIELKKDRRVSIGDRLTIVFENRYTLLFQIEEILRAENITERHKIEEEIDVYNALLPGENFLSATLFIEVPPEEDARTELDRLIGLDEHILLRVGKHRIRADFEPGRSTTERISAVQYTRYILSDEAKEEFSQPNCPVFIEADHSNYKHIAPISEAMRKSLCADLSG